jgi:hypothetical protein
MSKVKTHTVKTMVCLAAGLVICTAANAVTQNSAAGGPFHAIVERNVFDLHDPPPPHPSVDPEKSKPQPPPLMLTGLSIIFGKAKALFKVSMPAKPGEPSKDLLPIIAEGGPPENNIEVIHIDVAAGIVRVRYFGVAMDLSIKDNGPKIASAPSAADAPGLILRGEGTRSIPLRHTLRSPGGSPTSTAPNPNAHMQAGLDQLSPEQYAALLEVERERNKQDVDNGMMAPLPVTQFTPQAGAVPEK